MSKRKFSLQDADQLLRNTKRRRPKPDAKKHTLDSDEEDEHDEAEEQMDAEDIEGEEEGVARQDEGVRMTAFNMKEEMEEGHFDRDGHFIWNNEREIRDNWLDNLDWQKISTDNTKYNLGDEDKETGLGDESDSDSNDAFDDLDVYKKMIKLMKPKESVNKAIRRLGGDMMKLSSVERLKRKKAGTLNISQEVTDLTEFANNILTKTGNMDVYQETFEEITRKIERKKEPVTKSSASSELDMYSDDFDKKEQQQIGGTSADSAASNLLEDKELMWEFKWDQDKDKVEGPFDTKQMIKWSNEGYFKTGVWVRKCGEESNFYTSNRIDFELYE